MSHSGFVDDLHPADRTAAYLSAWRRVPFWGTRAARVELGPFPVKIKIKVKGSGHECPLHTIEIPTSRKECEKWGTQAAQTARFGLRSRKKTGKGTTSSRADQASSDGIGFSR
jgi:hypothetical protein